MSAMNYIRDAVRKVFPSLGLRNKPGGLAFVRGLSGLGRESLNGAVVTTVRRNEVGTWDIEPTLRFVASDGCFSPSTGQVFPQGSTVTVAGMEDAYLEPFEDTGITDEEVDDLYQPAPKVPEVVS